MPPRERRTPESHAKAAVNREPKTRGGTPTDELVTRAIITDGALFQNLVRQWRAERGATSSITQMVLSPAYQRIIGMGGPAVPLILAQLRSEGGNPDHWGWALHAITGEDPIPPEAAGDTVQIARAWLEWDHQRYAR